MSKKSVIIIGGGVIGLFTAYYLQRRNYQVTILDEGEIPGQQACSFANAGMLVPSHFTPLAAPGAIKEGLKSLLGSDSPIGIKWSLKPEFTNWMWKFFLACRSKDGNDKSSLLAELNLKSRELFIDFESHTGLDTDLNLSGIQMICQTEKTLADETEKADRAHQLGIPCEIWSNSILNSKNPGINADVAGAVYYPLDGILDPGLLLSGLSKMLKDEGVNILENMQVKGLRTLKGRITEVYGEDFGISADEFVMASGISMNNILKTIGLYIPLISGKGLSFTIDSPIPGLKFPSLLQDQHIAITPYQNYLRIASGFSIDNNPSRRYSMDRSSIFSSIKKNFNSWPESPSSEESDVWVGNRPVTPDGLPVIGKSAKFKNLNIVGGHAMMGLSLAPVSGMIISDIIDGGMSEGYRLDLLSPERFG